MARRDRRGVARIRREARSPLDSGRELRYLEKGVIGRSPSEMEQLVAQATQLSLTELNRMRFAAELKGREPTEAELAAPNTGTYDRPVKTQPVTEDMVLETGLP
jgi:hypothetical protein